MRSQISEGNYVKVTNTSLNHAGNTEMAEKLKADMSLLNVKSPVTGSVGKIIGHEDGFILLEFDGYQFLMDVDGVEPTSNPEEVSILVRYMKNNSLEEFENMDEVNKRLTDLMKSGNLTLSDDIRIYNISKMSKVKLSLEVFLG